MATRNEIGRQLGLMALAYKRDDVGEPLVRLFEMMLNDYTDEQVRAACEGHMRTSKFFPAPSEIIERIADSVCDLPTPEVAWSEVLGAIHAKGSYETPEWKCEPIATAVARMGWSQLCATPSDTIGVTAAQFRGIYAGLRAMAMKRVTQPGIAGPSQPPSLLGMLKTCRQCHRILPMKSASDLCAKCLPPLALPAPEDAPLPNGVAKALGLRWRKE